MASIEAYLLWSSYLLDIGYEGQVSQLNEAQARWGDSQEVNRNTVVEDAAPHNSAPALAKGVLVVSLAQTN